MIQAQPETRYLTPEFFMDDLPGGKASVFLEILEKIPQGIAVVNTDFAVCYASPIYLSMLGIPRQAALGRPPEHYDLLEKIGSVLNERVPLTGGVFHIQATGTDMRADIYPLFFQQNLIGVVICTVSLTGTMKSNQDVEYYKDLNAMLAVQLNIKAELPAAFRQIICRNQSYINLLQRAAKAAPTNAAICISGENGVGKEMIAEAIHYSSKKATGPFVRFHCGSVSEDLLESELFGHEGGAPGRLELANRGTLFLDEIGELPMNIQAKLLRALQDRMVERLDSGQQIKTDFRLITASKRDLATMVAAGTFREDLYYRINVIPIPVPPLRERPEDIPELAKLFLEDLHRAYDRKVTLTRSALTALTRYDWPGNVRELKNLLEQIYILLPDNVNAIDLVHLPVKITRQPIYGTESQSSYNLNDILERAEKEAIVGALQMTNNNRSQAIELLGISRRNFYLKLKKYEIK